MAVSGGHMDRGELRIHDSLDELATDLVDYIATLSEASVKERGFFAVALSGGSLISLMRKLYEAPYNKTVDWAKWHIFWADERVVGKSHTDSNYKLAKDGFLSKRSNQDCQFEIDLSATAATQVEYLIPSRSTVYVKVPVVPSHVYSINDSLSAEDAASEYEFVLRQLVKSRTVGVCESSDCPKFDLILLGMGPDGHVASLFPNHTVLDVREEWITFITDSPKPPPERITFTLPVINSASNVVMVVTGGNKAETVQLAISDTATDCPLPARMVRPTNGKLVWFLDRSAASKLGDSAESVQ